MEAPTIIKPHEVMGLMKVNLRGDQEEFKHKIADLKHGQKDRLLNAMAMYPIEDIHFETEPDLEAANLISKRISDSLVAIGLEHTLQGMIAEQERQRQIPNTEGNIPQVEAELIPMEKKRKSKKQETENEQN